MRRVCLILSVACVLGAGTAGTSSLAALDQRAPPLVEIKPLEPQKSYGYYRIKFVLPHVQGQPRRVVFEDEHKQDQVAVVQICDRVPTEDRVIFVQTTIYPDLRPREDVARCSNVGSLFKEPD